MSQHQYHILPSNPLITMRSSNQPASSAVRNPLSTRSAELLYQDLNANDPQCTCAFICPVHVLPFLEDDNIVNPPDWDSVDNYDDRYVIFVHILRITAHADSVDNASNSRYISVDRMQATGLLAPSELTIMDRHPKITLLHTDNAFYIVWKGLDKTHGTYTVEVFRSL
jgi:hypothetical protein